MKKSTQKTLSLVLALGSTFALASQSKAIDFSDVPVSHWAYPYVSGAQQAGLISGTGNNQFSPDRSLTYGEFAVILLNGAFDGEKVSKSTDTHWSDPYLNVLIDNGLFVDGSGNNLLNVLGSNYQDLPISRQDVSTLVARLLDRGDYNKGALQLASVFSDVSSITTIEGKMQDIADVVANGIMAGTAGAFRPDDSLNRAEASVVIQRMLEQKVLLGEEDSSSDEDVLDEDVLDEDVLLEDELVEDELVEDELVEDELVEDELAEDELVEDELVEDELVEDELVEDELAEDELAEDELVEDELAEDELVEDELAEDETEDLTEEEPEEELPTAYQITTSNSTEGTVTVSLDSATAGTSYTVTVKANSGYEAMGFTANGVEYTLTSGSKTLVMPEADVVIVGLFQAEPEETSYIAPADSNGDGEISISEINAIFAEYRVEYPQGTSWTNSNTYRTTKRTLNADGSVSNIGLTAAGCAGWVYMLGDSIFGELPQYTISRSELQAGDFWHTGSHWGMIMSVSGDSYVCTEGNMNSAIYWDYTRSTSYLTDSVTYYSRHPQG